jgi:type IV pilus assembly protein PilB
MKDSPVPPTVEIPDASKQTDESLTVPSGATDPHRSRPFMTSFLEHLISQKILSKEAAIKAAAESHNPAVKGRKTISDILVDNFGVSREALSDEIARFYSFKEIALSDRNDRRLAPSTVSRILAGLPETVYQLAVKHKVLPCETVEGQPEKILVVTPNPADRDVSKVARSLPFKKFEICYMKEKDWAEFWRQVTMEKQVVATGLDHKDNQFEVDEDIDIMLESEINRGRLVELIDGVFVDAVRLGASDIHVVPKGLRKTSIAFRIDGELTEWYSIEDARSEAVVAVVKGRGLGLDRFERMAAQDGSAQKVIDDQIIRFRLSVLPVISKELGGKLESVVIRILKDADASISLEKIGFDEYSLRWFREAIARPEGMVILTGPTGCGKSTTLIAALRSVMSPAMNTITVEDPVEYLIEGARQVKLNHKLSFDDALRAILRHDPDIVMVGEIRDHITADIAIKLANTGHLTFSTLHTNDAPSAVSRLFKIGVEPFLIAQALNIIVAQRLVRKLCTKCRQRLEVVDESFLARVGFSQEEAEAATFYKPAGCSHCVNGYKGRVAIHESLFITQEIRDLIMESTTKVDVDIVRAAGIRHGMRTLRQSGLALVARGITTIEEVVSSTTSE